MSLEHQNPSKTSEKMGYFDRVTFSLQILDHGPQSKRLRARKIGLHGLQLLIFKMANNKVDLGQIRIEEIVYGQIHKDPARTGRINRAKRQV